MAKGAKTYKPADVDELEDIQQESGKMIYVLVTKNPVTNRIFDEAGNRRKDPEFIPRKNLLTRCAIKWDGSDMKINKDTGARIAGQPKGRRLIRYYDGCTSLFVDEQPTDKETIDQLMRSTRELLFSNGYLEIDDSDTTLIKYIDMCSYNADSKYRIKKYDPVFRILDVEKEREATSNDLDELEEAMSNAKNSSPKSMMVHARFLGVPMVDYKSGRTLSTEAIRAEYRKFAKDNPVQFNKTFHDKTIHLQSWIEQAMKSGEINTDIIPNKAMWGKSGGEICDISGLKSAEGILNKLIEFSQSKSGADFVEQLEALYKD